MSPSQVLSPVQYIVTGPTGAGKTTLCAMMQKKLHVQHISTGDLPRAEVVLKLSLALTVPMFIVE